MIEDEKKREDRHYSGYLFSDEEMNEMITDKINWEPVSNIDEDEEFNVFPEPSEAMKKTLEYHQKYINFWKIKNGIDR